MLGALLAAPQVLLTAQIYRDSSRDQRPFPFVTATGTSVHPVRFVEQAVPFPFGRPDLAGAGGFTGHAYHDNHTPYLWTLHLGLATLALLVLYGRPLARAGAALVRGGRWLAVVLSLGRAPAVREAALPAAVARRPPALPGEVVVRRGAVPGPARRPRGGPPGSP